jgi:ABC-2 type transport system ATP-binding protein
MAENIVKVVGLTKKYGKNTVLDNVNITLERGKIYGFIGQNGAGKTTMINHINGLIFPDEGEIELFGKRDKKEVVEARKRVGTVCEHAGLHDNYNARDNIRLNMKLRGIKDDGLVDRTIDSVGLRQAGNKKFRNYSMGMKQRLAIGCAMLSGPELLLLDEPINGLDPVGIIEIRNLLLQLNQKFGVTILISSHILTELHELATDYIIIDKGHIVDCVSAEKLDARCRNRLIIKTNDVQKVLSILKQDYNIEDCQVTENRIAINHQLNSDEFAWKLYNEKVFFSEFYMEEETLEDYFVKALGGGNRG